MPPAMFGYMRLTAGEDSSDEIQTIQTELATHATREGFSLERVFIERLGSDDESAFFTLVDTLKTSEIKHVIVPSLWHFARLPGLQAAMRDHIEREIGARLYIVQGVRTR
ncbi:recombinase family protein [Streptomyces ossamyceticus]|uniref:recombinase family protein n=1 Tax=Streptomyces ossamyceticus TaxID=249581 RepID=UPI0006E37ED4|nr:recombinase family protein [Streptomyces ossamyceticus]